LGYAYIINPPKNRV